MKRLFEIAHKKERTIIGLNSGTSVDAIDAVLVKICGNGSDVNIEILATINDSYPENVVDEILKISTKEYSSVDQICRLNYAIAECFAHAALAVIEAAHLQPQQIDLIGSHGQTIHHLPSAEPIDAIPTRSTLQIGEPSVIAKRTGIITIADFRHADMALGGQGAPLVSLMDYLLYRSKKHTRGILNIGGIANLTILKRNTAMDDVIAFDTGPGNMVIDGLMQKLLNKRFDNNGTVAEQGNVSYELLEHLLKNPYFARPLPKSTGREEFGQEFIQQLLKLGQQYHLSHQDLIATVTMLTVETILIGSKQVPTQINEIIVSGGGAYNSTLMNRLRQRFSQSVVTTTDEYGIPADSKEAILFALLANETISGNSGNIPSVTGATAATVLGKICL